MDWRLSLFCLLSLVASSYTKDEPELPLCPTGVSFFPQNLPMHCRMPSGGDPNGGGNTDGRKNMPMMPPPPPYYQSPPPGKGPQPMPFPVPPMPGLPPPPGPMPGFPPPPGPMPMPMPMPMPFPGPMPLMAPAQKLPVIVMPFYSQDRMYKRPKSKSRGSDSDRGCDGRGGGDCRYSDTDSSSDTDTDTSSDTDTDTDTTDTDTSSDTDSSSSGYSSGKGWWKQKGKKGRGRRRHRSRRSGHGAVPRHHSKSRSHRAPREGKRQETRRNNLLTPIIQYVTNDGYVIFEKEISKNEAKNWLHVKKQEEDKEEDNGIDVQETQNTDVQKSAEKKKETYSAESGTFEASTRASNVGEASSQRRRYYRPDRPRRNIPRARDKLP